MKIRIDENTLKKTITEELKKSDVVDVVKNNKDIEKYVKKVAAEVVNNLFQTLFQQKSFLNQYLTK